MSFGCVVVCVVVVVWGVGLIGYFFLFYRFREWFDWFFFLHNQMKASLMSLFDAQEALIPAALRLGKRSFIYGRGGHTFFFNGHF